jgi:hypothetical protein
MAEPGGTCSGRYRVEVSYTSLALVSPGGTIVRVYWPRERALAEEDARRLNDVSQEVSRSASGARRGRGRRSPGAVGHDALGLGD